VRRALVLLVALCSACLEAPPGSTVLDGGPSADAFGPVGDSAEDQIAFDNFNRVP